MCGKTAGQQSCVRRLSVFYRESLKKGGENYRKKESKEGAFFRQFSGTFYL